MLILKFVFLINCHKPSTHSLLSQLETSLIARNHENSQPAYLDTPVYPLESISSSFTSIIIPETKFNDFGIV